MSDFTYPSPNHLEYDLSYQSQPNVQPRNGVINDVSSALQLPTPPRPSTRDSSKNLESFKVGFEDPVLKVLPAALKKYKNEGDWQNYAMFICYGPTGMSPRCSRICPNNTGCPGNRTDRCLSYDEKPLLLYQKLKDASKDPIFMLKHIKDIPSPIAVAQQKHAARKASASGDSSTPKPEPTVSHARTSRPHRLQVHRDAFANVVPPLMTGASAQPGWPEVMTPTAESEDREDATDREWSNGASGSATSDNNEIGTPARKVLVSAEISYAVAIYPYMAEQDDEFDVVVYVFRLVPSHGRS